MDKIHNETKMEQMRHFYEIFPYPNRFLGLSPLTQNHLTAHGAFATLLGQFHSQAAQQLYALQEAGSQRPLRAALQARLKVVFPPSSRILLVGCGTDEPLLFRKLHPTHEIVALDLSQKNIKLAKRKLKFHSFFSFFQRPALKFKKTEFIVGEACHILSQKFIGNFDYIQCFGVLHHQPQPENLLARLAERLTDNGVLRIMIYSFHGRRLERKIQHRYRDLWDTLGAQKHTTGFLFMHFLKLRVWQFFNFLGVFKSTFHRFHYLGMGSTTVADALMHPSDPGLRLEDILQMAKKCQLELAYCQAKIEEKGTVCGFEDPNATWNEIMCADKEEKLLNNPVLIFRKKVL